MPITPTYPGVYVQEIPSGVHTITGVATSITAFVGGAPRGPANDPTDVFSYGEFARVFGGLTSQYMLGFAVRDFFNNGGSHAIIVRVVSDTAAAPPPGPPPAPPPAPPPGPPPAPPPAPPPSPPPAPKLASVASIDLGNGVTLAASSPGSWGNGVVASVLTTPTYDPKTGKSGDNATLFNLLVKEIASDKSVIQTEQFYNVSITATDPNYIVGYLEQNSNLVVATVPAAVTGKPAAGDYTLKNGDDGAAIGDAEVVGPDAAGNSLEDQKKGIYALAKADLFNLLVIPPYKQNTAAADLTTMTNAAAIYCQKRRAFFICDPPDQWNTDPIKAVGKVKSELDTLAPNLYKDYGAVFFPSLRKPNPLMKGQIGTFAPSGTMAGVFARTDANRGVWKAPAGIDAGMADVSALAVPLTDDENGDLNQIGVNCLRSFPIIGRVVWGSRTFAGADLLGSDYKYIPVRRTALFIEESLYRGTKWVVFEPNDEPLWAQIRLNVGAFMHDLFRQGAFQGKSARDAYFVKCDDETTTQNDIDKGIVNILVGFAPLKPAEFVMLQIQQIAGQIQT